MEDTGQDGVSSSPATPGTSKSKLDSLPKEELIKFAKKQLMLIQKVKSRCTDLEKEIETLKSRPVTEETDVVQALTERLDTVLLERAETHQQLVSLKKEYAKTKEEAKDAATKTVELQQQLEHSSNNYLKEIKALKNELEQTGNNHKEDVDTLKRELKDALLKQKELADKLAMQEDQEAEMTIMQQQLQQIPQIYEDKICSLLKELESATEERNLGIDNFKNAQAASEQYRCEIKDLHDKILTLENIHKEEETSLKNQLETSMTEWEKEKRLLQDLIKQYGEKEKMWQDEMNTVNEKNSQEVEVLHIKLAESCKVHVNSSHQSDEVQQQQSLVKELESQQSLLKDELTYINHLKTNLETEVEHLRSDYFHEREELEFKINELQLAIEEYNGLIEKLKTELQCSKLDCEQLAKQKREDTQAIRDQHKKEMLELKQATSLQLENERLSFVHEVQLLKEQCDKLHQEKEEAVSSYEALRETFVSLQVELGESAGKISREFEVMKQQQATDVHELQQKLRITFKNNNDLLETVNRLQAEVDLLSPKQKECEDLNLKIIQLHQMNDEYMESLHQKDKLIKDLQFKVSENATELSSTLNEEIEKLREMCETERSKAVALQQETESLAMQNAQLHQTVDILTQDLQKVSENLAEVPSTVNEEMEKLREMCETERNKAVALQQETESLAMQNAQLRQTVEILTQDLQKVSENAAEVSSTLNEEIEKLREMCETEQSKAVALQQETESLAMQNAQLRQTVEILTQDLQKVSENAAEVASTLNKEIEKLREMCETEQSKAVALQQETESLAMQNAQLRQTVDILTQDLQKVSENVAEVSSTLNKEIEKLREICETERSTAVALQQETERLAMQNAQLHQNVDILTQDLQKSVEVSKKCETEALQIQITQLQQKNEEVIIFLYEKEALLKDLHLKIADIAMEKAAISTSLKESSEEILKLLEMCESEKAKVSNFQLEAEGHANLNMQLEQTIKELTNKMQEFGSSRDHSLADLKDFQQHVDTLILDKQTLQTDSKKWQDEVSRLKEEKDLLCKDFDNLVSEHSSCLAFKEEMCALKTKLQLVSEGKDEVTSLLEHKEHHLEELKSQLYVLLDILAVECTGQDLITILQDINKAVLQLKEEKQNAMLQREETSVQLDSLQEEFEIQCSELRALLSDYSKENVLLKQELEETLRDKEALQRDLLEMKNTLEKSKLDNQDLSSRIEHLTLELNALQIEKTNNVESNKQEKEDISCDTKNKELAVGALHSVQESLSESKALELQQQAVISDLQKKIETLERECKEKEEKCNKIKGVAIKAKKELDANKKEVKLLKEEVGRIRAEKDQLMSSTRDLVQGAESYQNLLQEYDKQVELLEVEKERVRSTGNQLEETLRQLRAATHEHEKLKSANEDLVTHMETLQSNNKLIEAQLLELQRAKVGVEKDLEAEKLIKEQKLKDHNNALKQIEELQAQLQKEKKQFGKITEELGLVKKDAQKSMMMDMEIADYDRLVKELNKSITVKNSQLEDLEQEIHVQRQKHEMMQEQISLLQTTVEQHEERSRKMKQLLIKTKKELADSKQAESDHLILHASLKGELEASLQHVEAYKIQVAELTSEKHKVQEQLRTLTEQHQRAANTYQHKLLALQEECTASKAEQAAVTAEFESYKVRVHNVLKQQKNKSASQAEQEAFKQEREHLQTMLDQMKTKLQETQLSLQMNTAELQALQSEHDMLLERHNKMLQETVAKEAELREKLCMVQSENMVLKTENVQSVSQLSAQNEAQRNSFRDQVRHLQDDHRKTVETLQQQLSKVEAQLFQLKNEVTFTNPSAPLQPPKGSRERRLADLPILDLYSAREDGEGMETMDTESVSSASTHIATLEQLLNSPDTKTVAEAPQWQPELSKEELEEKLNTTSKSVDHLSGLLHETEATNAILMEQITLLKNEIRRLERNQEREKSVANLEYLKNVLLQFMFLKAGSERQRLLPVIDTMLQLSPEEKGKLFAIAQGEEESATQPAGWASYLHSWSGLR